jgi:NADH-quinone oxidoreductase subunit N
MSSEKNFLGYITVLIGFLYKMALFPYYWWFDDILSGSSNIITFFLALIPKLPLVYLIYEWYILFLYIYQFEIIYYMSIITIIWTAILTLYQTKIKKLLAYSSILHSSMVLLTISIESGYIWTNIAISLLYLFTYISTTLGLILILILIKKTNITELKWDKGINVTIRLFISLILITLAGIPPFICFYLKLLTFYLLAQNGHYYVLITLLLLTSISLIYYIRLIRLIFFNIEEDKQLLWQEKWDSIIIQILILSIIMNITFLIWGIPIYIKLITLSYISLS